MLGKIIGTSLAGITQFAIWLILGGVLMVVVTAIFGIDMTQIQSLQQQMMQQVMDQMHQKKHKLFLHFSIYLCNLIIALLFFVVVLLLVLYMQQLSGSE